AGFEFTIHSGVYVVFDYRRATELFSDARAEREVLESQIRGFDYVASVEINRTGSADTDCRELILIDAGFFHCFACNAGDRAEDLFVIAPSPGFSARAGDNESRGVQYRRHYLSSTQIYSKYVTSHFHDPSSACFRCSIDVLPPEQTIPILFPLN